MLRHRSREHYRTRNAERSGAVADESGIAQRQGNLCRKLDFELRIPDLRIEIEGHTCNIGTSEYNLALAERRANAVREYLTSRGIAASRLNAISYGEERPKHDNAREETRRLNRRAALTVRLQQQ